MTKDEKVELVKEWFGGASYSQQDFDMAMHCVDEEECMVDSELYKAYKRDCVESSFDYDYPLYPNS